MERAGGHGRNWDRHGDGGRYGRKKSGKSNRRNKCMWTQREKGERLLHWSQANGGPCSEYTIEELESVFRDGLLDKTVAKEWVSYMRQWRSTEEGKSHGPPPSPSPWDQQQSRMDMPEASLRWRDPGSEQGPGNARWRDPGSEQGPGNARWRDPGSEQGPGNARWRDPGSEQGPGNARWRDPGSEQGHGNARWRDPGSEGPATYGDQGYHMTGQKSMDMPVRAILKPPADRSAELPQIQWHDFDHPKIDNMGRFFMNKFYLHEDKSKFWKPPHLAGTMTQLKGLEDLVPLSGLERALVVNELWLGSMMEYVCRFPATVSCTVICAKKTPDVSVNMPEQIVACPTHSQGEHATYRESGEVADAKCNCLERRRVLVIHPDQDERMRCHFYLLRYAEHLRIVITSASFNPVSWDRFSHFGWYCDLPVTDNSQTDNQHPFKVDLSSLLQSLGGGIVLSQFLDGVNFSTLSPLVHLVTSTPGKDFSGKMGLAKLNTLKDQMAWPSLYNKKVSVLQTNRLRAKTSFLLEVIFNLPSHASKKANHKELQVVYPSQRRGLEVKSQNPNMTAELVEGLYENFDRFMDSSIHLHDLDTDVPVYAMANIFRQHQCIKPSPDSELPVPEQPHCGWLLTGSHVTGVGSWGTHHKRFHYKDLDLNRYDISVGIFPYHDRQGGVLHALDLRLIGLPFHNPRPHHITDFPYSPLKAVDQRQYHCIGQLVRHHTNGGYGFVESLPHQHPMSRNYDDFPKDQAFLHRDVSLKFGLKRLPDIGCILEFVATLQEANFRIAKVIRLFQSEKEAVSIFGSAFMMGLTSEEEQDQYWRQRFNKSICKLRQKNLPASQEETDAAFPMNPTRLAETMAWLEKHVRQTCHGRLPQVLNGPYNLELLKTLKAGYKSQLLGQLVPTRVKQENSGEGDAKDVGAVKEERAA